MKTWDFNENNDLVPFQTVRLDEEGNKVYGTIIGMASDLEALRIRIDTALQVVKGEVADESQGVDYFGIVFSDTPISMKIQEISRVILSVEGVEDLEYKNGTFDKRTNVLKFFFIIKSAYGEFDYDKSFEFPA